MPGRYGDLDYARLTKRSLGTGVVMFLIGLLGEFAINAEILHVPPWEETLLLDLEALGVIVILLSPFVFGVLLPLTE